jgi:hypothetical protein
METKNLKERASEEFRRFVTMFLYLWVMFSLFQLHEYIVLAGQGLPYVKIGFAVINALVFAKVMLLAEAIPVANWLREKPLYFAILARTIMFALLFMLAHVLESVIEGLLHHQRIVDSLPSNGGGLLGAIARAIIIAFSLIPFLAFEELDLLLGHGRLRALLFAKRLQRRDPEAA